MAAEVEPSSEWTPAFDGQRPPFAPGHRLSVGNRGPLKHGAWSPRRIDALARTIIDGHLDADPDLDFLRQPKYAAALWAWARAEARVQLVDEYVTDIGLEAALAAKPGTTSAMELLRRLESTATSQRSRLGLDPLSYARLGRDVVATAVMQRTGLADWMEHGAELAADHEQQPETGDRS